MTAALRALLATLALAGAAGADAQPGRRAPLRPFLGLPAVIEGDQDLPRLLSATGAFADLRSLTPVAGIAPFAVNQPLWSDHAAKRRWIAIPNDGAPYGAGERAAVDHRGPWRFPAGTVLIKHFELPLDLRRPDGPARRLETRLLTVAADGAVAGVTYRWRDDGSDAELQTEIEDAVERTYAVIGNDGAPTTVQWTYPSRSHCIACHTPEAGGVLGVTTRQLNRPAGPGAMNQLVALAEGGWLDQTIAAGATGDLPRLHALDDATADAVTRVRSYLDANCAHCHHPDTRVGGGGFALDLRASTPLDRQGLLGTQAHNPLEIAGGAIVAPGQPAGSVLFERMTRRDVFGMPPVGSNHVDQQALALLRQWIAGLPEAP